MPNFPTMGTRKGIAPVIWVIIAAVLLGGGYLVAQKSKSKMESVETVAEQVTESTTQETTPFQIAVPSDWNTYRNEEYGFEFRYPASWQACIRNHMRENKTLEELIGTPNMLSCVEPPDSSFGYVYAAISMAGVQYEVLRKHYLNLKSDIENNPDAYPGAVGHLFIKGAIFGGKPSVSVCSGDSAALRCSDYVHMDDVIIVFARAFETQPAAMRTVERISSTFKFTKPAQPNTTSEKTLLDTTDWKMFRSPSNFVFSYPPTFTLLEPRERVLVSLSSPACDFSISLDSLDTTIGERAVRGEGWYASIKEEEVKVGDSSRTARLVYDKERRLQLMQIGGYIPGVFITMGTPGTGGLSDECIRQFYTMLSTFVP